MTARWFYFATFSFKSENLKEELVNKAFFAIYVPDEYQPYVQMFVMAEFHDLWWKSLFLRCSPIMSDRWKRGRLLNKLINQCLIHEDLDKKSFFCYYKYVQLSWAIFCNCSSRCSKSYLSVWTTRLKYFFRPQKLTSYLKSGWAKHGD